MTPELAAVPCSATANPGLGVRWFAGESLYSGPSVSLLSLCRPGRLRGAASRGLGRFAATPPSWRTQASIVAPFPTQARKGYFGHVHKVQWISTARRLSAGGLPNKSHSDHAGISKKKMSESQIAAQGMMNSAISPTQKVTRIGLVCSLNMAFSGAIAVRRPGSTATPAPRLKDRRFCAGGSPAAHRRRR
jgi:hypothetical protein